MVEGQVRRTFAEPLSNARKSDEDLELGEWWANRLCDRGRQLGSPQTPEHEVLVQHCPDKLRRSVLELKPIKQRRS